MTDDEKLACLDKTEADGWQLLDLQVEEVARIKCLEVIERCQRIRANLKGIYSCLDIPIVKAPGGTFTLSGENISSDS